MCCDDVGTSVGGRWIIQVENPPRKLVFDESLGLLMEANKVCDLSLHESKVAAVLICHAGRIVSVEQLLSHVWQYASPGALHQTLTRLRKDLRESGISSFWESRRGFGYILRGTAVKHSVEPNVEKA